MTDDVGLCLTCRWMRAVTNRRGSTFLRCGRADTAPRFPRYPALPMLLAGFYGGRRFAVMAGVFVVALIFFYQYVQGLDMLPGFYPDAVLALGPWAGFLILTGYVVGGLAEQREARLAEVKNAYMATLELLTYHIESAERNQQGHSNRVAEVAAAIGRELKLADVDVEDLRVAALRP